MNQPLPSDLENTPEARPFTFGVGEYPPSTDWHQTFANQVAMGYQTDSNLPGDISNPLPLMINPNPIVPSVPPPTITALAPVASSDAPNSGSRGGASKRKKRTNPSPSEEGIPDAQQIQALYEKGEGQWTLEDKKVVKKYNRLVKNREAAQLFRQRQKEYIQGLENRAALLTLANNEAKAKVELLSSENTLIKEQLIYLRQFLKMAVLYSYQQQAQICSPGGPELPPNPEDAPPSDEMSLQELVLPVD